MSAYDEPTSRDGNPPTEEDAPSRPPIVITKGRRRPPAPGAFVSPVGHVSVVGYPGDKSCQGNGVGEISDVVKILENAGVPCCMVLEPALIYYGSGRIMNDWIICVPDDQLDKAADLFRAEKERFEPFMPCVLTRSHDMSQLYPRFKFKGLALFFYLMPSKAGHIVCEPQNIERSDNGIPYPQLHLFAQSLLDTGNFLDLEDLIDSMNLMPEWGEQNLNLDGTIDKDWLLWRESALQALDEKSLPLYLPNLNKLPERRKAWMESASAEAKKRRQGIKYREGMATRWRREGHEDPRIKTRKFC